MLFFFPLSPMFYYFARQPRPPFELFLMQHIAASKWPSLCLQLAFYSLSMTNTPTSFFSSVPPPPPCSSHTSISFFSTPQSFHPTIFHSLMSHHIVVLPLSLCLLHHLLSSCHLWCAFCSVQLHCRLLEGKTGNKCTAVKGKAL